MIMSDNIAAELDKRIEKQAQDAASGLVFKSHLVASLQAAYLTLLETCVHPSEFKRGVKYLQFACSRVTCKEVPSDYC